MMIENGTEIEMVEVDSDSSGGGGGEGSPSEASGGATTFSSCLSLPYKRLPPFVHKIHQMVEDEKTQSIVCWRPTGTSFVIWQPHAFGANVLPLYFKHNNFQNFVCQLNSYGFKKLSRDRWEFGHEYFRKGEPHLLENIKRRKKPSERAPTSEQITSPTNILLKEHELLKQEIKKLKDHQVILAEKIASLKAEALSNQQKVQKMLKHEKIEEELNMIQSYDKAATISSDDLVSIQGQSDDVNGFSVEKIMELVSDENETGKERLDTSMSLEDLFGESPEWSEYMREIMGEASRISS